MGFRYGQPQSSREIFGNMEECGSNKKRVKCKKQFTRRQTVEQYTHKLSVSDRNFLLSIGLKVRK